MPCELGRTGQESEVWSLGVVACSCKHADRRETFTLPSVSVTKGLRPGRGCCGLRRGCCCAYVWQTCTNTPLTWSLLNLIYKSFLKKTTSPPFFLIPPLVGFTLRPSVLFRGGHWERRHRHLPQLTCGKAVGWVSDAHPSNTTTMFVPKTVTVTLCFCF